MGRFDEQGYSGPGNNSAQPKLRLFIPCLYRSVEPGRIETVGRSISTTAPNHQTQEHTMNPQLRAPSFDDFDFDTLPLAECWPWLKGAFIVVVGSIVAGFAGLFDFSLEPA